MFTDWNTLMTYDPATLIASCVFSVLLVVCLVSFLTCLGIVFVKHQRGKDSKILAIVTMTLFLTLCLCAIIDATLTITAYQTALRNMPQFDPKLAIPV